MSITLKIFCLLGWFIVMMIGSYIFKIVLKQTKIIKFVSKILFYISIGFSSWLFLNLFETGYFNIDFPSVLALCIGLTIGELINLKFPLKKYNNYDSLLNQELKESDRISPSEKNINSSDPLITEIITQLKEDSSEKYSESILEFIFFIPFLALVFFLISITVNIFYPINVAAATLFATLGGATYELFKNSYKKFKANH